LKEAFVDLTLGQRPLTISVLVANIIEFMPGLDVLHTHDASVAFGCRVL
jgi:hypothetical protein